MTTTENAEPTTTLHAPLTFRPEFLIRVKMHVKDKAPTTLRIESNVKTAALEEVMTAWVQDIMINDFPKAAQQNGPASAAEWLTVSIGLTLNENGDVFGYEHDCGNDSLAFGTVLHALRLLSDPTTVFTNLAGEVREEGGTK